MYVSRLTFHTIPGKSGEVEKHLISLREMAVNAGAQRARILHTHFASLGAPDVVFEQEAADLAALEKQIGNLTANPKFQKWSSKMSQLLNESPKREVYIIRE